MKTIVENCVHWVCVALCRSKVILVVVFSCERTMTGVRQMFECKTETWTVRTVAKCSSLGQGRAETRKDVG